MLKKLTAALLLICLLCLPLCSLADGTLNVFNYGEYIDEEVLYNFEKEFGVRINYSLNSNPEEMYTKLQTGVSYDVVVTSDYMIDRLIKEERILPLDKSIVTNLDQLAD
ncbi:MAG: spermidine/putrescine ABC transporter substrate-binding protein, partial [Clostridia bacterium]